MSYFFQQLVNGLSDGMVYAGMALALVVVFHGSGILNIAQGEMATFSAYLAWAASSAHLPWPIVIVGVVALSFVLGVGIERVFIKPVERATELNSLIVTLAVLLLTEAVIGSIWGFLPRSVPSPFGDGATHLGGVTITHQQIGAAVTLAVLLALLYGFFQRTAVGIRMRAATDNAESARLLGVRVGWMLALGWGLAAAMGGVVGILAAPQFGLDDSIFLNVMLYAFAAATLGGLTSMPGAVIGGLVIGVTQTMSGAYVSFIGSELNVIVPFVLILAVLLIRPAGLLGRETTGRV
mgnify:CR=1 FL=1